MIERTSVQTRRLFRFVSILTLVVFVILAGLFLFKMEFFGDSDIWWYGALFQVEHYSNSDAWLYGAVTGFFAWLFLGLLIATAFLFFRLRKEAEKRI
jgi:hypothetical protein